MLWCADRLRGDPEPERGSAHHVDRSETPSRRNVAVLLAGGVGARVGLDIPKQLIKIAGRTILEHSLAVLDSPPGCRRDHRDDGAGTPRRGARDRGDRRLRQGDPDPRGRRDPERHHAARLGGARRRDCKVLFHDAVRPLVSARIISECFEALDDYDAVDVAIPSADTIIEVDARQHDQEHPAARAPAPRPDTAGVPGVSDQAGVRARQRDPIRRDRRLHGRAPLPPGRADLGGRR